MSEPIILVDVMNLVFRCGFVFQNLSDEDDNPTGVQYGVLKTLADLRENVSRRVIFCWDHGVPIPGAQRPRNWREDILTTYKASRNKKHDDTYNGIIKQLPALHDVLSNVLGYPQVAIPGLEADDLIGLFVGSRKEEFLIFSTDRDLYQLLDEARAHILVPKKDKKGFRTIYQSDVERELEISIKRWPEYLALGGDSSDNIKPMRGMGPKTAIKLVQAGADLQCSFSNQKKTFISNFGKYESAWNEIQKSYDCARIPTSCNDSRIASFLSKQDGVTIAKTTGRQTLSAPLEECRRKFDRFCAEREMNSILALRHKFFDGEKCQLPTVPPPPPKRGKPSQRNTLV